MRIINQKPSFDQKKLENDFKKHEQIVRFRLLCDFIGSREPCPFMTCPLASILQPSVPPLYQVKARTLHTKKALEIMVNGPSDSHDQHHRPNHSASSASILSGAGARSLSH